MLSYQIIDIALDDSHEVKADNDVVKAFQAGLSNYFLRVQDHSFPDELDKRMREMTLRAFAWPPEVKNAMSMANSNHFSGFTGYGDEVTNGQVDNREVFDFVVENSSTGQTALSQGGDGYEMLAGRNRWPPSIVDVDFRLTVEQYMCHMREVYRKVLEKLEDVLDLPVKALQNLDTPDSLHRLKLIKYHPETESSGGRKTKQGVGAHQDSSGWLTFVQEIDESGLQVFMQSGKEWIEVPLGPNAWGVNIGKAFERSTNNTIHATLHRVETPGYGKPARHSMVFFAGLPLGQSYASLQQIFIKSAPLASLQGRIHHLTTKEYQAILDSLKAEDKEEPGDTFGSSQLKMWNRSYKCAFVKEKKDMNHVSA